MEIKGLDTAFEKKLLSNAKKKCKTIVLPEAGINEQVMLAGLTCAENKIAKIVMLVSDNKLLEKYNVTCLLCSFPSLSRFNTKYSLLICPTAFPEIISG